VSVVLHRIGKRVTTSSELVKKDTSDMSPPTMKAARFYQVGEPLRIETVGVPTIGPNDTLVRIRACGICHTDLHFVDDGLIKPGKIPLTLGHEAAGEVVEVGNAVAEYAVGDRVLIHFYFTCGECYYCQQGRESLCIGRDFQQFGFTIDGGYAEYARAPARNLVRLPDGVPFEAGILVDAGSTAYHAVREVGRVRTGASIVIVGAGGVGLCAVQVAKISGARVAAVDISDDRLKVAEELGADMIIKSTDESIVDGIMKFTRGRGADAVFELVGRERTMRDSVKSLKRGGRLVCVGYSEEVLEINPLELIRGEIQILASRASSRRETAALLELVRGGRFNLDRLVTHSLSLDHVNEGLDLLRKGTGIRTVVKP
jgi:propanol-preferring alcohol dehydrogenase